VKEKLEILSDEEKEDLKNRLKTYQGYQSQIDDLKESMREQVKAAADEINGLTKKEVRKIFAYFRKKATPDELREDAEALEEIRTLIQ
jgi:hypothetical protein